MGTGLSGSGSAALAGGALLLAARLRAQERLLPRLEPLIS
jgi:hypothetical protein